MAGTTKIPASSRHFGAAELAARENADQVATEDKSHQEPFWESAAADDLRLNWNESFPFQLLLVKKVGRNYDFQAVKANEKFTLPIPPQSMAVDTPFAIQTSVTQGGILEEHNGAPIRMITLAGTTGILPLRGTVAKAADLNSGAAIFAGTVSGLESAATAIDQASNLLGTDRSQAVNVNSNDDLDQLDGLKGTGFYQFLLLKRFLESYVARKRAGESDLRLAFCVWKEQEIYLVTPVSFSVPRSAQSPNEYPFNLVLKAWRRLNVKDQQPVFNYDKPGVRDPNRLAQVANAMETGRRIVEAGRKTLEGVRADIQNVLMTPLRQASLFVKDSLGLTLTAIDLPTNIITDLKEPLLELAGTAAGVQQLSRLNERLAKNSSTAVRALQEAFNQLSISAGKADVGAGRQLQNGVSSIKQANTATKASENPLDNFEFFSTIRLGDLNLRADTVRKIEAERQAVRNLRRKDFEDFRDNILRVAADFSDFVGAGAATYSRTYSLPTRTVTRTPTDSDWDVIFSLNELAQSMDTLAATSDVDRDQVTSLDYVAGLAAQSGIAFQVPRSKFAIPFPYGNTLEQVSNRYLGDPDRWLEIAALNGLRAPYVDETGFKLPLLAPGNGNQLVVADGTNLVVGQRVWVQSNAVRREIRRLQGVRQLTDNQWVLTLNGDPDLSKFVPGDGATLQSFLPGTVNSQQLIYIPSDTEPDDDSFRTRAIPGIDVYDPLLASGGIDLLLTASGDLVINSDGSTPLAYGLTNLIQKVKLALGTRRGTLLHHPGYGIGIKVGTSTADLSALDIKQSFEQFFKDDPGYSGVESVSVRKYANTVTVRANVGLAATGQFVPVEVEVRK